MLTCRGFELSRERLCGCQVPTAAQMEAYLCCRQLFARRQALPQGSFCLLFRLLQVAVMRADLQCPPLQAGTKASADSALLKGAQQQAAALKQSLEVSEHLAEARAAELLAVQERAFATEQQLAAVQSQGGLDRQALKSSRRQLEVLQVSLQAVEGLHALRVRCQGEAADAADGADGSSRRVSQQTAGARSRSPALPVMAGR